MSQIQDRFQLEIEFLRLERKIAETGIALRQAKYDLREAKIAEAEYGGSFKRLRDNLTGKREAAETALRHETQKAEANLASAQRQKEVLDARISEVKVQLSTLPDWQSLRDGSRKWFRLEGLYCVEALSPLLVTCLELLIERRNQFNGTYAGEIKTRQDLADIYFAPEAAGEACKTYLLRLKAALDNLSIPFETGRFFDAPTAFLSEATKFTRMDRINTAVAQTESLQRRLSELQKKLTE